MPTECQKCGLCCRKLIIEIGCHDIVREPKLIPVTKQFKTADGPCGFITGGEDDGCANHDGTCHMLTCCGPCPLLSDNNLCTIYPTRPNVCVGFSAGGTQCRELRGEHLTLRP